MKTSTIYIIFSLLFALTFSGCKSNVETDSAKRKVYQCKDYEFDIPIETVDAETNGKKFGETHFHSVLTDSEIVYSYENFASINEADKYFSDKTDRFTRKPNTIALLRKERLKDQAGAIIGKKIVYLSEDLKYNLLWTNETKFNSIISESIKEIEEIEKDCNL